MLPDLDHLLALRLGGHLLPDHRPLDRARRPGSRGDSAGGSDRRQGRADPTARAGGLRGRGDFERRPVVERENAAQSCAGTARSRRGVARGGEGRQGGPRRSAGSWRRRVWRVHAFVGAGASGRLLSRRASRPDGAGRAAANATHGRSACCDWNGLSEGGVQRPGSRRHLAPVVQFEVGQFGDDFFGSVGHGLHRVSHNNQCMSQM